MAADRDNLYEVEELLNQPGTYFNPQTEVLVVVDDSASMDAEIFNLEQFEGADWVLISDDLPVDEAQRDELLESFQASYGGDDGRKVTLDADELDDDVEEPEEAPLPAEEVD